jgi:pimeloyl-ACP methyl ester carboxylesterase
VIDGNTLRYIKTGKGRNLVLLHTLRTQLDIFEKLVPLLSKSFTVYALDYPGHGFSDIPKTDYDPDLFVKSVEGFLDKLDLKDVTLAGISIGGVIPLIIAAKQNPLVAKVIAINPYDYAHGMGIARGNAWAWLVFNLARIPVLGETVMRLRSSFIEWRTLVGGVAEPSAITPGFAEQVRASGFRPGHYRAFLNLLRHAHLWDEARRRYGEITFQSLSSTEIGIGHAPMRGNAQLMPFLEPSPRRSLTAATSCLWTNPSGSPGSSSLSAKAPKTSLQILHQEGSRS